MMLENEEIIAKTDLEVHSQHITKFPANKTIFAIRSKGESISDHMQTLQRFGSCFASKVCHLESLYHAVCGQAYVKGEARGSYCKFHEGNHAYCKKMVVDSIIQQILENMKRS